MSHRFHILGLPWTHTTVDYSWCAYTQKVVKFAKMMTDRGDEVIIYSGAENDAVCTEHVEVITPAEQADILGTTDAPWNPDHPAWVAFNHRAIIEINKRRRERDYLLLSTSAQKPVADALPMQAVEYGIGYSGVFAPFKVFESYAWFHTVLGHREGTDWDVNDQRHWFDQVIPNYFDPDDFHVADPDGYFLFIGRGIRRKGPQIAADVCEHLGARLVIAGHDLGGLPAYGERVGPVGPAERADLMAGAIATFVPTTYVGPFEGVAVESLLSGTPVITTDVGAFCEYVHEGDGWRCHTMAEFADAARAAQAEAALTERLPIRLTAGATGATGASSPISWPACREIREARRQRAIDRFSLDVVGRRYEAYFDRLHSLWGEGWPAMPDPTGD